MDHGLWRERAALHVYGELDESELEELEQHLVGCGECRELERELRGGLAALAGAPRSLGGGEEWLTELRSSVGERIEPARTRAGRGFGLGLASGIAAGVLAAFLWGRPTSGMKATPSSASLERATPPPLARSGGEWSRLGEYLRR